jgi:hypothetical protein
VPSKSTDRGREKREIGERFIGVFSRLPR